MKIRVKKVKAWEADGAPAVWGFFGSVNEDIKKIFNEVTHLTEVNYTKEHPGKFYYNNAMKFWYVRDTKARDMALDKIKSKYGPNSVNVVWNTGV